MPFINWNSTASQFSSKGKKIQFNVTAERTFCSMSSYTIKRRQQKVAYENCFEFKTWARWNPTSFVNLNCRWLLLWFIARMWRRQMLVALHIFCCTIIIAIILILLIDPCACYVTVVFCRYLRFYVLRLLLKLRKTLYKQALNISLSNLYRSSQHPNIDVIDRHISCLQMCLSFVRSLNFWAFIAFWLENFTLPVSNKFSLACIEYLLEVDVSIPTPIFILLLCKELHCL